MDQVGVQVPAAGDPPRRPVYSRHRRGPWRRFKRKVRRQLRVPRVRAFVAMVLALVVMGALLYRLLGIVGNPPAEIQSD
jgi:hypothetical protein